MTITFEKVWREGNVEGIRLRYTLPGGKKQKVPGSGVFKTRKEAQDFIDGMKDKSSLGATGKVDLNAPTQPLVDRWILESRAGIANIQAVSIKDSTAKNYRLILKSLIVLAPTVGLLTDKTMREWKLALTASDKPRTICRKLTDARTFCRWLLRGKMIAHDPFEKIGIKWPPSVPRYFDDEEIEALEKTAVGSPFLLALRMGYQAGLRHNEILRIEKEDIRWLPNGWGELRLWADETKNGENRTVPLVPAIMGLAGTRGKGLLFAGWTKMRFEYTWAKLKALAGIEEPQNAFYGRYGWSLKARISPKAQAAHFHDLRHTFCRLFLERNAGRIERLAEITGHKDLNILKRVYGHFSSSALHESMAILEASSRFRGETVGKNLEIYGTIGNTTKPSETRLEGVKVANEAESSADFDSSVPSEN